jgi:hypothetical protein
MLVGPLHQSTTVAMEKMTEIRIPVPKKADLQNPISSEEEVPTMDRLVHRVPAASWYYLLF